MTSLSSFLVSAVVEGAFEMADQLLLAAERDQGGDDDQAAVALRQAAGAPRLRRTAISRYSRSGRARRCGPRRAPKPVAIAP